jgi:PEP-CTERM motif-containing protein
MKCKQLLWLTTAVAVVSMVGANRAHAVPYHWGPGQIKNLANVTAAFHGGAGQLSTINSITQIPRGIELNVTYRIGQEADPFGANYGLGFARVSLQGGLGTGLNIGSSTSSDLRITTTTDITAQSFVQTDFTENGTTINDGDANTSEAFSFLFWEHNDGVTSAGGPTVVDFDFASGTEFSGDWGLANPQAVQGTNTVRAWGLQLAKFSGVVIGQPITATIRIESLVPEPTTVALVSLAVLGLAGFGRRRST